MLGSNGRIADVLKPRFAFSKVHDFKYGSLRRASDKLFPINLFFPQTNIYFSENSSMGCISRDETCLCCF